VNCHIVQRQRQREEVLVAVSARLAGSGMAGEGQALKCRSIMIGGYVLVPSRDAEERDIEAETR
jgi:hypothetical protein